MAPRVPRTFVAPSGEVFTAQGGTARRYRGSFGSDISRRAGAALSGRPLPSTAGKWQDVGVSRVTGRQVFERESKAGFVSSRPLERFLAKQNLSDDARVQIAFGIETRDYPRRRTGQPSRPSAVLRYGDWKTLFAQAQGSLANLVQLVMPGDELRSRVYTIDVGIAP